MNNSSNKENFEKLNINPFSDLLLQEDIDFGANLFNETKFQHFDFPLLYSRRTNKRFRQILERFFFLFFI